jgi:hypothetical protein
MKWKHGERDRTSVSLKSQQKTQKARGAKEKAKTASSLKGLTSTNEKRADTWSSLLDGPERTRPGKGVFASPSLKVDMDCGYERSINLWISH